MEDDNTSKCPNCDELVLGAFDPAECPNLEEAVGLIH